MDGGLRINQGACVSVECRHCNVCNRSPYKNRMHAIALTHAARAKTHVSHSWSEKQTTKMPEIPYKMGLRIKKPGTLARKVCAQIFF